MTMPIQHKFIQTNFGTGFETHNAILDITPYKPEIMIIGTFNPDTPNSNYADFFYGRNYFWTGFKNLFIHNSIELQGTRMPKHGKPKKPLNPDLDKIKEICQTLKLTFADFIAEVLHNETTDYQILDNDNVCFKNRTFNLIQDDKKGQIDGLVQLHKLNQVKWSTKYIIKYLCENPTIKTVYLTRQAKGIWLEQWNEIIKDECLQGIAFTNIFTPSGQGKPVLNSMPRLLKHWVHNTNPNFGKLDNNWLRANNVNLNNF
jgi:hypothetical protein